MKKTHTMASVAVMTASLLLPLAPAASASPQNCDPGSYKRVLKRVNYFSVADQLYIDNRKGKGTVAAAIEVGETHTSRKATNVSLTASVEASFFSFAKASASTTYGVTLEKSVTMAKTYRGTYSVPAGKASTLQWGFLKVSQQIQQYHLVRTNNTCKIQSDKVVTLSAPYKKAFRTV